MSKVGCILMFQLLLKLVFTIASCWRKHNSITIVPTDMIQTCFIPSYIGSHHKFSYSKYWCHPYIVMQAHIIMTSLLGITSSIVHTFSFAYARECHISHDISDSAETSATMTSSEGVFCSDATGQMASVTGNFMFCTFYLFLFYTVWCEFVAAFQDTSTVE